MVSKYVGKINYELRMTYFTISKPESIKTDRTLLNSWPGEKMSWDDVLYFYRYKPKEGPRGLKKIVSVSL